MAHQELTGETGNYQPQKTFPCIRDDGMICMGNDKSIQLSGGHLRPYHGPINAKPDQIQRYLAGFSAGAVGGEKPAISDDRSITVGELMAMGKDALIDFAMGEYGLTLNKSMSDANMREKIMQQFVINNVPAKNEETAGTGITA